MATTRQVVWTANTTADPRIAARVLGRLCVDWPTLYRDPAVGGNALGVLQIQVKITDHDRWMVGRRIRDLRTDLEHHLGVPLPAVTVSELPPHRHPNRGVRTRGRRQRDPGTGR